jgi:hypothetical protein
MKLSEMSDRYQLVIPSVWVSKIDTAGGGIQARIQTRSRTHWEIKSDFSVVPNILGKAYVLKKQSYYTTETDQPRTEKQATAMQWQVLTQFKQKLIDQYLAAAQNKLGFQRLQPKHIFIKDIFNV